MMMSLYALNDCKVLPLSSIALSDLLAVSNFLYAIYGKSKLEPKASRLDPALKRSTNDVPQAYDSRQMVLKMLGTIRRHHSSGLSQSRS